MVRYFSEIYVALKTILIGMVLTFRHMFVRSTTVQYPHQKLDIPERARNLLLNKIDDCIGCDQCVRICPVECIVMETIKLFPEDDLGTTSDGKKKNFWIPVFDIDMAKCCFCGFCTTVCPTECLIMTGEYEYSTYDRKKLVYHFIFQKTHYMHQNVCVALS